MVEGHQPVPHVAWRRRVIYIVVTVMAALVVSVASLVALDLWLQARYPMSQGLNRWGYRGRVLQRKVPDEYRVAVLGGSTTFGWGVPPDQTLPAYLENILAARRRESGQGPVSVANLAYNSEGAFAAKVNLADYLYLQPDVVVFYDGYNDLRPGLNAFVFRHESPVFRLTGYVPILPLVLQEKAMVLRYGSLEAAYRARNGGGVVLHPPGVLKGTVAAALDAVEHVGGSL